MIMTHGWPGSVIEFNKVIGPLTDPVAYRGDAFHLVLPSLPGYGFSDKPTALGWGFERIARAWATLMDRLGYDRYVAQGGTRAPTSLPSSGQCARAACWRSISTHCSSLPSGRRRATPHRTNGRRWTKSNISKIANTVTTSCRTRVHKRLAMA